MTFSRQYWTTAVLLIGLISCRTVCAQTTAASVGGQITDQQGHVVTGARVVLTNINTGIPFTTITNGQGIYTLVGLQPGLYRANVTKEGFKGIVKSDLKLHVQDQVSLNFALQVGSVSEVVTVQGGAPLVNTQDASVSTVVDRNFAENLPMNGRTFQSLIELTPGVVVTPTTGFEGGQFSVNGQRSTSNYWTVDGVSGNVGIGAVAFTGGGNGLGGSLGSFTAQGGTNGLVSIDAVQEFRIQTSTYAPEFGRTPGGQISIVTRSGTNKLHGSLFDYFRNDVLDASDWFNGYTNTPPLPKAKERQNDFGGTLGGPMLRDKTFFFFSYEGLRLRLPETELTTVPDLPARSGAAPALQPYLSAYPRPNGSDLGNGVAQLNASFSNPSSLNAYSIRVDHELKDTVALFARYNYSPSDTEQRGSGQSPLSDVERDSTTTQTGTLGGVWTITPNLISDGRFNYSRVNVSINASLDNFGGSVPLSSLPFPSGYNANNSYFNFGILSLSNYFLNVGKEIANTQRQLNIVDSVSWQKGGHSFRFGVDYRRLTPINDSFRYLQQVYFNDVPSASDGILAPGFSSIYSTIPVNFLFRDLGMFAQDTWRARQDLVITYGARWDIEFAPATASGPALPAAINLGDPSTLGFAPPRTPTFQTRYNDFAPRIGIAYQLTQTQAWQTVLRGGFGLFYDTATQELGNLLQTGAYPFGSFSSPVGPTFPLSPSDSTPPPIAATPPTGALLVAFNPRLLLPYTLQWNFAVEQSLGNEQVLTSSYVGSAGRRLIQSIFSLSPNPSLGGAALINDVGSSDYNALQIQYQRRLARGFQALASYTWSHSIDTASDGQYGNGAAAILHPASNRGSSDYDVRQAVSSGFTYEPFVQTKSEVLNTVFGHWSFQSIFQAHSATPVNVTDLAFFALAGAIGPPRADIVPGQPFYVNGTQCQSVLGKSCPGEKGLNPAAFAAPPIDPSTGEPIRQGNMPRNALRGFSAWQWDFALHREFPIHERLRLQFRAEAFNILNHPNFGPPVSTLNGTSQFGLSNQTLGRSLSGGSSGTGGLSPLYQIGGPRSLQLALKLTF